MIDTQAIKNKILGLAIQGKLTEQRSEDGTAEELLEQIRAEKKRLIAEGKIKREKALPPITKDEKPFDIPEGWCWVRLGDVCNIARGGSPRPIKEYLTKSENGINWIKIGDTAKNSKYIEHTAERIIPAGISRSRFVHSGDFLLTNSMSFGRPYILKISGCIHDGWLVISQLKSIFQTDYLYWLLSSDFAKNQFNSRASGAVVKNLNIDKVSNSIVPLPPLAEQERIVERIEQAFSVLDTIDEIQAEYEKNQDILKNKLLELAIHGNLTDQRPEDGTAEELLEQIRAEKKRLIAEGKIKREKALPPIKEDEKPFDIPESWTWERWGNISFSIQYGYNAPALRKGPVRMVRISDIQNNEIQWSTIPYCEISNNEIQNYILAKNDILFARTGGTVGKSYLVNEVPENTIYAGYLIRTRFSHKISPQYIKFFMGSNLYWQQLRKGTTATAQPNCNGKTLSAMIVPLPPLAEQERIVERLNELLPLCERMR